MENVEDRRGSLRLDMEKQLITVSWQGGKRSPIYKRCNVRRCI